MGSRKPLSKIIFKWLFEKNGFSAVSGSDLGEAFNKLSEAEQLLDLSQIK